jgi:hypothetical protein
MKRRWLFLAPLILLLAVAACGPSAEPTHEPEVEKPSGDFPIRWLLCAECRAYGSGIPLWDSPARQRVVAEMPHLTFVYVLDQQTGPDGQTYYRVWVTKREGWVEASFVAEQPFTVSRTPPGTYVPPASPQTGTSPGTYVPPVAPQAGTPYIVLTELSYDFGNIPPDNPVEHIFTIKNTGTGDLIIQSVISSCSCTSTMLSRNPIPPGQEGQISAIFDPKNYAGQQVTRSIQILSNDPANPQVQMTLTANVLAK